MKQFWIAQGSHADIVCYTEKQAIDLEWTKPYIHVIDYDSYQKLKEESLKLRDRLKSGSIYAIDGTLHKDVVKEIESFDKALEEIEK